MEGKYIKSLAHLPSGSTIGSVPGSPCLPLFPYPAQHFALVNFFRTTYSYLHNQSHPPTASVTH